MPEPADTIQPIRLDEDWQVHSTFSDGAGTLEENVQAAIDRGLRLICLNDHVRHDTPWVADFVTAVRTVGATAAITVHSALEAKILDTEGRLDLPPDAGAADLLLAADHQVPSPDGPRHPAAVAAALEAGELTADTVLDWIERGTIGAIVNHPRVLVAHMFSVLPKIGIDEREVSDERIERIGDAAARHGAIIEVSERWSCPSLRAIRLLRGRGVRIVASTDAHRPEDIGRYDYCRAIAEAV